MLAALALNTLLFHAPLTAGPEAVKAAGDPKPLIARGLRFDNAAVFPPNAELTYDARGNLYAEQGEVSFEWRPDAPPGRLSFPLLLVSYEQHSTWDFNFLRVEWTGTQLAARIRDRNLRDTRVRADASLAPRPGQWMRVVVRWSERAGLSLEIDGKPAASAPGPLDLDARLDQFGILTGAVTPHHTAGTENPGSIRDLRVFGGNEATPDLARRHGWSSAAGIPKGAAFTFTAVPFAEAKDLGKFWYKGGDGKRETLWPMVSHGYEDEGKTYRIRPSAGPVNAVRTTGDLQARIAVDGFVYQRAAPELHYQSLPTARTLQAIEITRQGGVLGDLTLLRIEPQAPGTMAPSFAPARVHTQSARRHPGAYTVWKEGLRTVAPAGRYHYLELPTPATARGVRLRLRTRPGAYVSAAVLDPANPSRHLIAADAQASVSSLALALRFAAIAPPPGSHLTVELISSADLRGIEAIVEDDSAGAVKPHLERRVLEIRDSFQMLSEARPWMRIGRNLTLPALRRQLKLVDELFTLMEDARRVDPAHPIVNGYWSWVNRAEAPPKWTSEPPPEGVPAWAHRQTALLRRFREVARWWIDHRQIATGELGGGLGDDTDLIQNWPGIALLDGPAPEIRDSARRVLEACYAQKLIDRGMNAHRTDALHAYEEGMNAYGPVFLMDYGNPVVFERMLETASHYPRLTGVNAAGHRHFRSYRYSATDLVEEGYHAREDIYSHLILHPGLYVAWYNGEPALTQLLREFGDGLLAHWSKEQYPDFAKEIFFASDEVRGRSSPNTETFNLFWGLFELTGDARYRLPLEAAIAAGDFYRASSVNAPWLHFYNDPRLTLLLAEYAGRKRIDDHNLQTDQEGLIARSLLWQARGDTRPLDDAHAALLQHMDQNLYLYTKAEQFTDRIWIPTLSVQRERLGGVAHYRNYIWPGHAVSWENTGGEIAALIARQGSDRLTVRVFNTGAAARKATMRVWRLAHGLYEIKAGAEPPRIAVLKRDSTVEFEAPPRREIEISVKRVAERAPLHTLPDLAIAAEEIAASGPLAVTVHNIGAAGSAPYRIEVRDAEGRQLAAVEQPGLGPVQEYRPSRVRVPIPGVAARPGLRITLVHPGDEICERNNAAAI